jgi:hypothetical protein
MIKTECKEASAELEWNYPMIGECIFVDLVVLFSYPGTGTIIHSSDNPKEVGAYREDFDMKHFVPSDIKVEMESA